MSDSNFVDNVEEGDESSDVGVSPEYGNPGTIQDENGQPPDVISFDAHDQTGEREADKTSILRFFPLSLPQSPFLVDSTGNPLPAGIQTQAHLRGRFSHSEDSPSLSNAGIAGTNNKEHGTDNVNGTNSKDAIGLIFYRRNKFKVFGTVSIPVTLSGIKRRDSHISRITSLHAELDAIESLEGTPVRVIHSNPKEKGVIASSRLDTASSRSSFRTTLTAEALPRVDLRFDRNNRNDESSLESLQQDPAISVPVCWEKLQFRHATAKKRGTWQYFYLRLTVTATLEDGKSHILSRTQSSAITVRGRSPQSFPSHTNKLNRSGPINARGQPANNFSMTDPTLANMQDQGLPKETTWRNNPMDFASIDCQAILDVDPENLLFYDFSDAGIWNNSNLRWQDSDVKNTEVQEYLGAVDAPMSPVDASINNNHTNNNHDLGYNNNLFIPSLETHLLPSIPNLGSIFNLPHSLSSLSADYSNLPDMSSTPFTSFPLKAGLENNGNISDAIPGFLGDINAENKQSKDLESETDETDDERRTYSYEYIPLSINDWTVPVEAVYVSFTFYSRVPSQVHYSTKLT
jgi:NDT80 / PhoG like DNA-binding  family